MQYVNDSRAATDKGDALFIQDPADGKYHLFLPVTNMPATGAAPDQQETTVTTSPKKTYVASRQDTPQKAYQGFAHRDNFMKLSKYRGKQSNFLQINSDYTGFRFSGSLEFYQTDYAANDNRPLEFTITVSSSDEEPILNVFNMIKDTVIFEGSVPTVIELAAANGVANVALNTAPADATVTAASDNTEVATTTIADGKLTVTGVAAGSALITVTGTKTGLASNFTTILVIVPTA